MGWMLLALVLRVFRTKPRWRRKYGGMNRARLSEMKSGKREPG